MDNALRAVLINRQSKSVARKLINICLAWTLVLGCWGGVLAAVACPHRGCETKAAATSQAATHYGHQSNEEQAAPGHEDHPVHKAGHRGHAAAPSATEQSRPELSESARAASRAHDPCCSHCVGRPDAPPSPKFEWQYRAAEGGGKDAAPQVAPKFSAPSAAHQREISPAQHAPPRVSDRHLFIGVLRI